MKHATYRKAAPCDDMIRPGQQHPYNQHIENGADSSIQPVEPAKQAKEMTVICGSFNYVHQTAWIE
jgi:hypothetical protein